MIVKIKCCFLKKDIDSKELEKYGFFTLNDGKSYWKDYGNVEDDKWFQIGWYAETRRFVYKYPKMTSYRFLKKHIKDLLNAGIVEVKPMYEWWAIIGRWQDYSDEKLERIENKIIKLNKKVGIDYE